MSNHQNTSVAQGRNQSQCLTMTISCKALQAVWEAEELKGQLLKTETELQDSRAALGTEADAHAEAERQLQQVRQHRDSLQVSCDIWHRDLMDCQRECNRAMHMRTRDLLEHWAEAEVAHEMVLRLGDKYVSPTEAVLPPIPCAIAGKGKGF